MVFCDCVVGDDDGFDFDDDHEQPFFDGDDGELFSQQVVDGGVDEQFSQPGEEKNKRLEQLVFVEQPKYHPLGSEQHIPRQTKKPMLRKKFYISCETPCCCLNMLFPTSYRRDVVRTNPGLAPHTCLRPGENIAFPGSPRFALARRHKQGQFLVLE